jgi:hypothetical protein
MRAGPCLVGLATLAILAFPAPQAMAEQRRIAVIPPVNASRDVGLESIAFLLGEAAHVAVVNSGGVIAVDRLHLMDALMEEKALDQPGDAAEDRLVRVGKAVGASHLILGAYTISNGVTRVSLRLVDVATRAAQALGQAHAPASDLLGLRDEVFCVVRQKLNPGSGDARCQLDQAHFTNSLTAMGAYSDSLLALYRGRQQEAHRRLNEALAAAPDYGAVRELRDALYWTVAPGNEWVYAVREFQAGASDSSGADDDNESPVAPVASLEMVRRVSGTRRMQNGDLVVDTSVRLPRFISNVWGECEGEVRESYVLTGGWARLGGYWRSDKCDKLSRPLEITVSYSPAIPWLPLNPDAAGSAPDPIEVTAATRVVGVATAYRKLDCAFTAQPRPQVATPFGSLDGARISTKCVEAEAPTWAVENQEKASAYQAKMDEHKKEVKKPDEKPQAFDDLMLLLGTALWDETPEPEDIPASSFLVLSYSSFESTRTFVPGVGLIRESGRMDLKADRVKATPQDPRMLELRSRLGTDSQSASGRDMATMQDVRLSGMQIRRLSPMSSRPAGVEADPPPILLGETHRDSRSVLGGHSSMLEGGLFGFFRPRYVSVKLRYPDENRDFSSLGHIFSLGFSTWLGGMYRVGGRLDFLALPGPKGMSDDDVKKMYGKDYMAAEIGTLALDFRGRLAPRGWLSVPAIEAGLEGQLFAMSNKPDADDNGNVPKDYDKGTYGKEIDKTYYLGRAYLGLLGQFSFHDRVVLELGYRLSRWGGSFSFDDRARSISVLTEGANGSLCVGQSAKRDEGSIGLCFQLWADWPLGSNPNGAAGPGAFITGGQFTLTYRFGEMDTD